jgi:hypothetical protein
VVSGQIMNAADAGDLRTATSLLYEYMAQNAADAEDAGLNREPPMMERLDALFAETRRIHRSHEFRARKARNRRTPQERIDRLLSELTLDLSDQEAAQIGIQLRGILREMR